MVKQGSGGMAYYPDKLLRFGFVRRRITAHRQLELGLAAVVVLHCTLRMLDCNPLLIFFIYRVRDFGRVLAVFS